MGRSGGEGGRSEFGIFICLNRKGGCGERWDMGGKGNRE